MKPNKTFSSISITLLTALFQRNDANPPKYGVTVKFFLRIPKVRWDIFRFYVFNWFQILFYWHTRRTNVHRVTKKWNQLDTMPGHGGHLQQSYVRVRDMDVNLFKEPDAQSITILFTAIKRLSGTIKWQNNENRTSQFRISKRQGFTDASGL